ncbi:MAG: hypothetical protein EBZ36_18770 [Acidobacteria bacterium]|nr:hypothetical protein [Acidobacteriota bacterium]
MINVWKPEDDRAGLAAFATVLGVPTCNAPEMVGDCIAVLMKANARTGSDKTCRRIELFRSVAQSAPAFRRSEDTLGLAAAARAISEAVTGPFRRAPHELRGALFLVSALDFALADVAEIMEVSVVSLNMRLEALLDEVEGREGATDIGARIPTTATHTTRS